jgi:hypothetical protein
VFRDALGEVVGVLHLRRVLAPLRSGELDKAALESLLDEPYFVPASTPALSQIQYFQENHQRMALVVDEYGELMGWSRSRTSSRRSSASSPPRCRAPRRSRGARTAPRPPTAQCRCAK